ncbi:MAG: CBS domain-containing protein [Gammaproteobacteria bacterium]|jgi:CBS domain-containing protein
MLVHEYMSKSPVTVRDDNVYLDAFRILENSEMHHLPVVNANGEVVGILARRDLQLAARLYRESPIEISEIMHTPVQTTPSNVSLSSAAQLMMEQRIGCLPVLDKNNKLEGILTETDMFRALCDLLKKD